MGNPFQRRSSPHIDQVLGVHRSLAGKRPEHRGGKPRLLVEKTEQSRKGDRSHDAIAQRSDRIQRPFGEGAGKPDEVSGQRDVQYLATASWRMRQRIETPSININNASYFRPSVMISRLRRITRVSDCKSSRIAISSGASATNRLSFRVSGLATRGCAVVGRAGMSAPNRRLILTRVRHVRTADRGSQTPLGYRSRPSDALPFYVNKSPDHVGVKSGCQDADLDAERRRCLRKLPDSIGNRPALSLALPRILCDW